MGPNLTRRVAIIGAGPAGLAAARWLISQGFEPELFEMAEGVGGQWRTDAPMSGIWREMRTNTSRVVTRFSDLDYPPGTPVFPHNRDVLAHLEAYAAQVRSRPEDAPQLHGRAPGAGERRRLAAGLAQR